MNLNRNDDCWCKSGKKYKKCHMEFDEKLKELKKQGYEVPSHDIIKNKEQIDKIKESAKINNEVLDLVAKNIKEGMSTEDINKIVHEYTVSKGAIPAPLGYGGFPKSLCTSINSEICHGIPSEDVILKDGDIINIDVSTIYDGYYSDASRMFMIGNVSDKAKKLVEVTKECLEAGIKAVKPWGHIGDIGAAIQEHAEKNGYSVVRDFGGHGIGLQFHEDPFVFHYGAKNEGMILVPGMIFTIEPMINEGTYELYIDAENEWTAYTDDGLLSAQWEHMILVTEDGVEILSK
ncbi:methionyl aminopeptidase [Paraclostridium sordellii]|uniref:methionyl aminopeptidase n=1 Tax=Paraclostridium sordellii TaxID=1505 RepID=UPI0005E05D3C|nr:methionyl aminopeptidase [Paeniclostridium sordellii]MDU6115073.1 methionyl aminopeptidase [Paeniclostridium sordellii]CEP80125.1 methionine aminopeptidase [[Clostridium] sordellii] [Paeniclostridium sordellii]